MQIFFTRIPITNAFLNPTPGMVLLNTHPYPPTHTHTHHTIPHKTKNRDLTVRSLEQVKIPTLKL